MIDWTKECETAEDPPRPVRVLCTDAKGIYPVVLAVGNGCGDGEIIDRRPISGSGTPPIRNVATNPVRHEAWVNLYPTGSARVYERKSSADEGQLQDGSRIECRRIVWNRDGSPVEGEITLEKALVSYRHEYDALKAERDEWKSRAEEALRLLVETNTRREEDVALIKRLESDLAQSKRNEHSIVREIARQREANAEQVKRMQEHNDGWKHEYDRMKPVVDAATKWDGNRKTHYGILCDVLRAAVRAYHQGESEKSCENCANGPKYSEMCTAKTCASGNGYGIISWANWEPRR